MDPVTIRTAVLADLERISNMDPCARTDQCRRLLIESAFDRGECLVALDDITLLAYGVMNYEFFQRGFVALVYVDVDHRRCHLGTLIFDEFERRCRSTRIFTSTNLANLPMQALLASRGYSVSGVVQDLDPGDPEVFYSKKLR